MAKDSWTTRPLDDELGEALRAELLSWAGVTARQMMGTLAFFRRKQMLGAYVNRKLCKTKPAWLNRPGEPTFVFVRLRPEDGERALKRRSVRESRLVFPGWIEVELSSRSQLGEAVRWFGVAYENSPPTKFRRKKKTSAQEKRGMKKKAKKNTGKRGPAARRGQTPSDPNSSCNEATAIPSRRARRAGTGFRPESSGRCCPNS